MNNCPKCSHNHNTKDGIIKGKQRFKCKNCNFRFTVQQKDAKTGSNEIRKLALQLYLEGLGFRSIGRILNFSHVAIYQWIKNFGEEVQQLQSKETIKVVEIDEMHTYVGSKKTTVGSGLLLIDIVKNSSTLTLVQETLKQEKNYGKI